MLGLVKTNSPTGQVVNGNTITYSLVVSNESNVTAHGVVVTDAVPVGTVLRHLHDAGGDDVRAGRRRRQLAARRRRRRRDGHRSASP